MRNGTYYTLTQKITMARDWNAEKGLLRDLSKDKNDYIRKIVAMNTNTSIPILENLAGDKDMNVRAAVAKNISINKKIMIMLIKAKDVEDIVLEAVASNPNITNEIVRMLYPEKPFKTSVPVRMKLAGNVKVTKPILNQLAADEMPAVRMLVAQNLNTEVDTLRILATDWDKEIARHAQKRLTGLA